MEKIKNILIGHNQLPVIGDVFFEKDDQQKKIVIYAHGFNGFKDWGNFDIIAERFATAGFLFLKFNFSHNGTNAQNPEEFANLEAFGQNNYTKQLGDLKIVLDWVCDKANPFSYTMDTSNIYLIGHSMGAGIAILFASEDDRIKKLIGWAAIGECKTPWGNWPEEKMDAWKKKGVEYYLNGRTKQLMPLYYQLYEDYEIHQSRLDIQKAISSLNIPVLLCHGTADPAVPVEVAFMLKKWQPSAQLFTLETDHVFERKHPWSESYLPEAMEEVLSVSLKFLFG
ncbi:MAG: alpha/beta fold hydrolase [Ferruginibacter sp.]